MRLVPCVFSPAPYKRQAAARAPGTAFQPVEQEAPIKLTQTLLRHQLVRKAYALRLLQIAVCD